MKKFLLLFVISVGISYGTKSQTSRTDTICFKVTEVQNVLIAAKQKKLVDSLLVICRDNVEAYKVIVSEMKEIRKNDSAQRAVYISQSNLLNTQLKKQKRKTTGVLIIGSMIVSGLTYLWISK